MASHNRSFRFTDKNSRKLKRLSKLYGISEAAVVIQLMNIKYREVWPEEVDIENDAEIAKELEEDRK